MAKTFTIFKREVRNYFLSPLAYVVIGFFLILSGYFFSTYLLTTRVATMLVTLGNMTMIFIFIIPILTMRLLAEERNQGTEELLLTHPIRITSMVMGKYLAALFLLVFMLIITFLYPGILYYLGNPETGPIISGYLGIFLLGAAAVAIGLFASSVTENQIVAAIISFSILLLFWIIGWAAEAVPVISKEVFNSLSIVYHFQDFSRGVIGLEHVIYYLSLIFFFLFLTIQNIERRRWN